MGGRAGGREGGRAGGREGGRADNSFRIRTEEGMKECRDGLSSNLCN